MREPLSEVIDPDGRRVELAVERWEHIVKRHPELAEHHDAIMRAVSAPSQRLPGRRIDQEWFYLSGAGPSRWLKVIVDFDTNVGHIVTAFARRRLP